MIGIIGLVATLLGVMYGKNEEFRESINGLVSSLSSALMPILSTLMTSLGEIFAAIMPIIDVIAKILTPIIRMLTPIITAIVDLVVKQLVPAFEFATKVITGLFNFIEDLWTSVLQGIEDFVNWMIKGLNSIIEPVNKVGKFLGLGEIGKIKNVDFTSDKSIKQVQPETQKTPTLTPEQVISNTQVQQYPQTVTNNDYSKKDIKIEVVVQNYAKEVDIDEMTRQINLKLAEAF